MRLFIVSKKKRRILFLLLKIAVIAGLFLAGGIFLWGSTLKLPDLASFDERKIEQSTKVYDRTGEILLYDLHEDIRRTVIPFEEMSRHIKNATVAIEDAEFYEHRGVKPTAFLRAALTNLITLSFSQGGSTITQQVVKNSLLTPEKKISRKLKEWFLAMKLERKLSKEEILELYLNEVPYGGNIYGIEEAAQAYFGKSATELTLPESAYLAALPQAPTYYSPYGSHRDDLERRKNLVLSRMLDNNFISEVEFEEAKQVVIEFQPRRERGILAPHFVFFVREYLEATYGARAVEEEGFTVVTTLDYELQEKAEEIVKRFALENEKKFNAENAALVAIDPKTGHILTMVGSRDYFDKTIDGNFNVATASRQPGSAFKPIVYATALSKGYTPETVVFDTQTQFSTACDPLNFSSQSACYSPQNYDTIFRGPVTFREALAQSINVPAVKVLYLAGLRDSLQVAKRMGIETLTNAGEYGLTLVLGGGEVRPLDLTSVYGVFANDGVRYPATSILRVENKRGEIVEEFSENPERIIDPQIARQISDILSDNVARTPLYGSNSLLYFGGRDVAVKTGTTNDYRDAWTIGYTPSIAVGAWAGNNDNRSMEKQISGLIITPLWRAFMDEALKKYPDEIFPDPSPIENYLDLKPILRGEWRGGESVFIDKVSGKLATTFTPTDQIEERVIPNIHSILYWIDRGNPRGPAPINPASDPQFVYWESGVARWRGQNNISEGPAPTIPDELDDVHGPNLGPDVSLRIPSGTRTYARDERITTEIIYTTNRPIMKAEYYLNGVFLGTSEREPYRISFVPADTVRLLQENTLSVTLFDSIGNAGHAEVIFTVDP